MLFLYFYILFLKRALGWLISGIRWQVLDLLRRALCSPVASWGHVPCCFYQEIPVTNTFHNLPCLKWSHSSAVIQSSLTGNPFTCPLAAWWSEDQMGGRLCRAACSSRVEELLLSGFLEPALPSPGLWVGHRMLSTLQACTPEGRALHLSLYKPSTMPSTE